MKKWAMLCLVSLLSACTAFSPVTKPEVAVTSVTLSPPTGFQQQLQIGLSIDNSNSFGINLGQLRYRLNLAGHSLATGSFNESVALPANGKADIVVPVSVNLLSGIGLIRTLLNKAGEDLEYTLSLTAKVENFGLGDITISKSGLVGLGMNGASGESEAP
ncbi:MAG: LEA type 2 family protein [Spongiibacteraceae bacterium]